MYSLLTLHGYQIMVTVAAMLLILGNSGCKTPDGVGCGQPHPGISLFDK